MDTEGEVKRNCALNLRESITTHPIAAERFMSRNLIIYEWFDEWSFRMMIIETQPQTVSSALRHSLRIVFVTMLEHRYSLEHVQELRMNLRSLCLLHTCLALPLHCSTPLILQVFSAAVSLVPV